MGSEWECTRKAHDDIKRATNHRNKLTSATRNVNRHAGWRAGNTIILGQNMSQTAESLTKRVNTQIVAAKTPHLKVLMASVSRLAPIEQVARSALINLCRSRGSGNLDVSG